MNPKVFITRSFEETKIIELSQEKTTLKSLLMRFFITSWLFGANTILWFLKRLFFKDGSYSDHELKNITVYTVGTLGDNVLMLPAIAAIKRRYPNVTVTVITNCDGFNEHPAREILGKSPYVDRLITLLNHPVQRHGLRILVHFPGIQEFDCDLFVNLSPFGNRGWIGAVVREMIFAKKLGAKWAIGFKMSSYNRRGIFNIVQHHFVKNEARRPREILREMRFAYLGRIDPSKGLHILLKAAELLSDESSCEIHIFGAARNPWHEEYRKKTLREYKGKAKVIDHGLIPHDELSNVFSQIDVLVVPSILPEAFGLVVAEAFSAGRPVIVFNSGALPEQVKDGLNGFIIQQNNIKALSEAMQRFIDNPDLVLQMSENIRPVKTIFEYVNEIEKIYSTLLPYGIPKAVIQKTKELDFVSSTE